MTCMAIATALFEVAPMIKKMVEHPQKGQEIARSISTIAKDITQQSDPVKITNEFQKNPELLINFYNKLMDSEREMYLAMLSDRERARIRTTPQNSRAMLCICLGGLISCLFLMSYGILSPEAATLISTASGIFGACLKDIYASEFGGGVQKINSTEFL